MSNSDFTAATRNRCRLHLNFDCYICGLTGTNNLDVDNPVHQEVISRYLEESRRNAALKRRARPDGNGPPPKKRAPNSPRGPGNEIVGGRDFRVANRDVERSVVASTWDPPVFPRGQSSTILPAAWQLPRDSSAGSGELIRMPTTINGYMKPPITSANGDYYNSVLRIMQLGAGPSGYAQLPGSRAPPVTPTTDLVPRHSFARPWSSSNVPGLSIIPNSLLPTLNYLPPRTTPQQHLQRGHNWLVHENPAMKKLNKISTTKPPIPPPITPTTPVKRTQSGCPGCASGLKICTLKNCRVKPNRLVSGPTRRNFQPNNSIVKPNLVTKNTPSPIVQNNSTTRFLPSRMISEQGSPQITFDDKPMQVAIPAAGSSAAQKRILTPSPTLWNTPLAFVEASYHSPAKKSRSYLEKCTLPTFPAIQAPDDSGSADKPQENSSVQRTEEAVSTQGTRAEALAVTKVGFVPPKTLTSRKLAQRVDTEKLSTLTRPQEAQQITDLVVKSGTGRSVSVITSTASCAPINLARPGKSNILKKRNIPEKANEPNTREPNLAITAITATTSSTIQQDKQELPIDRPLPPFESINGKSRGIKEYWTAPNLLNEFDDTQDVDEEHEKWLQKILEWLTADVAQLPPTTNSSLLPIAAGNSTIPSVPDVPNKPQANISKTSKAPKALQPYATKRIQHSAKVWQVPKGGNGTSVGNQKSLQTKNCKSNAGRVVRKQNIIQARNIEHFIVVCEGQAFQVQACILEQASPAIEEFILLCNLWGDDKGRCFFEVVGATPWAVEQLLKYVYADSYNHKLLRSSYMTKMADMLQIDIKSRQNEPPTNQWVQSPIDFDEDWMDLAEDEV